jgi:cytoskeleton protein RodZ
MKQDQMVGTIGNQLRTAREARGLSLLDVEKAIHIRVHYLQALENDDFAHLPSKTQARGFLRLYADFLKIQTANPAEQEPPATPLESQPAAPSTSITEASTHIPPQEAESTRPTFVEPKESAEGEQTQKSSAVSAGKTDQRSSLPGEPRPAGELTYLVIYREIGDQLRTRRQSLSLSLDDISLHTRIKEENLELIEEGRMDDLPSPVQGRGMISNYSEFLNLDSDAVLSRFADALQLKRLELMPQAEKPEKNEGATSSVSLLQKVTQSPPAQAVSRVLTPDLLIGGSLALLLVILIIWGAVQVISPTAPEPKATAPSISEILLTTPTFDQALALTPGLGANTAIPLETTLPEQPAETSIAATIEGTLTFNQGSQPIQVYVIANQRAFLKISEDGSVKFMGRVVPGNAYQFYGYNKIELLTGNGAALQVIYNETDLGVLGDPGSVIHMVFIKDGFATATPAKAATPVNTRQPTLTIQPSITPTVTPYVP